MKIYLLKRKGVLSEENQKKGKGRKISLYLMYNFGPDQKREYEFLDLFLYEKPKTNLERDHNKETLQLAETIKAKKLLEVQTTSHGFVGNVKSKIGFLSYFKSLVDKRYDSEGNHGNWKSTYGHLYDFCNGRDVLLENVDDRFLEGFKEYLLTCKVRRGNRESKLHQNSVLSYYTKVRTALKEAYRTRMIKENPALRVKGVKAAETHREYLTFEELQLLARTECDLPILKKAFLFSALTGLRWSDVAALRWGNIKYSETDGWCLQYTQKKTKGAELLPVTEQAIKLLGDKGKPDEIIFEDLCYSAWNNIKLREWMMAAGITKKISFHCARHSFATLQLSMNTDIYTVSKLLGHKHLKTTEIYAKVIDKKKIAAARSMPELV
jgi:integrase